MKRKEMEKVSSLVKSPIQYSMQKKRYYNTLWTKSTLQCYKKELKLPVQVAYERVMFTRARYLFPILRRRQRSLARSSSSIDARTEGRISLLNQISAPPGSLSEKTTSILSPQVACDLRRGPCQASREPCRPLSCRGT